MGFLVKNKKNGVVNPYYFGNGCFNFPGLYEEFSLRIIGEFDLNGYSYENTLNGHSKLYECNLCYNYNDSDNVIGSQNLCYKLVVGFDIEKMIHDSKYTRFVFDRVINSKNLGKIHHFDYDFIDADKSINYIGSVLEINGNLVFYDDDNIRNIVRFFSRTKSRLYSKSEGSIDSEKRKRALMSSINRQAKIDSLKVERENLIKEEALYKSYNK